MTYFQLQMLCTSYKIKGLDDVFKIKSAYIKYDISRYIKIKQCSWKKIKIKPTFKVPAIIYIKKKNCFKQSQLQFFSINGKFRNIMKVCFDMQNYKIVAQKAIIIYLSEEKWQKKSFGSSIKHVL